MKLILDTDIETIQALMTGLELSITIQNELSREKRESIWKQMKHKLDSLGIQTPNKYNDYMDLRR